MEDGDLSFLPLISAPNPSSNGEDDDRFFGKDAIRIFLLCCVNGGDGFPKGDANQLGLDPAKLDALDVSLQTKIDAGEFPGAVFLLVKDGQMAHLSELGRQVPQGPPINAKTIFRLYSMTKPIVSVATVRLIENGTLALHDEVSKFIPEFKGMQVATGELSADGNLKTIPLSREVTLFDLLTHTSGIASRTRGKGPVRDAYRKARVYHRSIPGMESAVKLAGIPLELQPGEKFVYGHSSDVLGTVLERATGKRLAEILDDLVFGPLKMHDTGFQLADPEKLDRLAEPHADDKFRGKFPMFDPRKSYALQSASNGLVSTAMDYGRFCQMLLNGGELEGVRILSQKSVNDILSDQLGDIHAGMLEKFKLGFGYGFAVFSKDTKNGAQGTAFWGGAAGTTFWVDRKNNMFGVFMIQSAKHGRKTRRQIRPYIYSGLKGHLP